MPLVSMHDLQPPIAEIRQCIQRLVTEIGADVDRRARQ
jgi:hypothetical protein